MIYVTIILLASLTPPEFNVVTDPEPPPFLGVYDPNAQWPARLNRR